MSNTKRRPLSLAVQSGSQMELKRIRSTPGEERRRAGEEWKRCGSNRTWQWYPFKRTKTSALHYSARTSFWQGFSDMGKSCISPEYL